jgi:hypothetical protein
MRRSDRATDLAETLEIFDNSDFVTISIIDEDGNPYGIPLSIARTDESTFYFHCAKEGKKINGLNKNKSVWLTAVSYNRPMASPQDPTYFSLEYKSAMASGIVTEVTNKEEQILGLKAICQKYLPYNMENFDKAIEKSLQRVRIMKITVIGSPTGKKKTFK